MIFVLDVGSDVFPAPRRRFENWICSLGVRAARDSCAIAMLDFVCHWVTGWKVKDGLCFVSTHTKCPVTTRHPKPWPLYNEIAALGKDDVKTKSNSDNVCKDWLKPSHSFRCQRKSIDPGLEILRLLDELISCEEQNTSLGTWCCNQWFERIRTNQAMDREQAISCS